jgi:6-phosphogluconate dehydrogenase
MEIGLIGLGRMGGNMAERLIKGRHKVVGYARTKETVDGFVEKGMKGSYSIEELTQSLRQPRQIWMMIPAGAPVDKTLEALLPFLGKGDILIDGGNSNYKDTMGRAETAGKEGIYYIDVGVSGGVWGLTEGYSMMVGGDNEAVEHLRPIFETLAPGKDKGWGRVGPSGAGHFVKMVHNGIEYGLMQAYAEGFALMKEKEQFNLDLHDIAEIWSYGSVVRSWLLDLISEALAENPEMEGIAPYVEDSGEGRWTVFEAVDLDVAAPVITLSLLRRLLSRDKVDYSDKLLAAMRNKFGGHEIKSEE